jgi:hypothetical protein
MAIEKVTKRNELLVIHVPDMEVVRTTEEPQVNPDVLKVVARRTQPLEPWVLENINAGSLADLSQMDLALARHLSHSHSVSRLLPREVVPDFVGSKQHGPPLHINAFIQKYGQFHSNPPSTFDIPDGAPQDREERFRVYKSKYESERERFHLLLRMISCLLDGNIARAREIAEQLKLPYANDPRRAASVAVGARLDGHVVFALDPALRTVILKCPDVLTGLYAWLLKSIIGGARWSACPKCGVVFQAVGKRKYCQARCEHAEKQRRWRERELERAAQKAEVKSKRSKRQTRGKR